MPTNVSAAVLTVNLEEILTLNGQSWGNSTTVTKNSIRKARKYIFDLPYRSNTFVSTPVELIDFSGTGSGPQVDRDDVEFIRIWNLDTTREIFIMVQQFGDATKNYIESLGPQEMRFMFTPEFEILTDDTNWDSNLTLARMNKIEASCGVNVDEPSKSAQVEVMIASNSTTLD